MTACAPPEAGQLVAERLAGYLDCQSRAIAENGFGDIAGGSLGPALLTGCLTIYAALIGYRLILGAPFGAREAVLATVRCGLVIAFATNWSAYETVIFNVVVHGPSEVAANLLPDELAVSSLPEAAQRFDADYQALHVTTDSSVAASSPQTLGISGQQTTAPAPQIAGPMQPADPVFDHAGFLIVGLVVGALGAVQLAAGLLLGGGPIFVILGLFDATLGIFEGWVRALVAVFVGATGGAVVTTLELGFLETQLQGSQGLGQNGFLLEPTLMAVAALFGAAMIAVLVVAVVVGAAFRLPFAPLRRVASPGPATSSVQRPDQRASAPVVTVAIETTGRAQTVAEAVRRIGRSERTLAVAEPRQLPGLRLLGGGQGRSQSSAAAGRAQTNRDYLRPATRARTPTKQRRDAL